MHQSIVFLAYWELDFFPKYTYQAIKDSHVIQPLKVRDVINESYLIDSFSIT